MKELFTDQPTCAANASAIVCYLAAFIIPECVWGAASGKEGAPLRGLTVSVRSSGLPLEVGLGSSAAFAVATAGAMLRIRQLMFGDLLDGAVNSTLHELSGGGGDIAVDGWTPQTSILHIINAWAFGIHSQTH